MPHRFSRSFRVRFYECDAYGHVNNSNYVRYMQETAFDASAAVGYSDEEYHRLGVLWLIRDTEIEYLKPLRHGDIAEITTWIEDFRRVRSRRLYEVRRQGDDDVLARGSTDWVFLDRETLQPITIPLELKQAFFPEGIPKDAPRREPFPAPPEPPSGAVVIRREVAWEDVDPAGHVNNAKYFSYLEESGIQAAAQFGISMADYLKQGYGSVARKTRVEYKQPAVLGDTLEITTYLSHVRSVSAMRHFFIHRATDQELIAQAYVIWVFIDIHTGKPIRIPVKLFDDMAAHIAT